jgi:SAM-dependent methyltransferase
MKPLLKRSTKRSEEQIREHYELEKVLANKLRQASQEERINLYSSVYDELYSKISHHPRNTKKKTPKQERADIARQLAILDKFLFQDTVYLEIGPGDCRLAFEVAKRVKQVYGVDVSEVITSHSAVPNNFKLGISDGTSVPVPHGIVDFAYSNQVMEHLHPEDALEQVVNIFNAIAPGGCFLCITPNRLNGPHDISMYFDEEATGLHLKEYTYRELRRLFKKVGFSKVFSYFGGKGKYGKIPVFIPIFAETILELFPFQLRRKIADLKLFRVLIRIQLIGVK